MNYLFHVQQILSDLKNLDYTYRLLHHRVSKRSVVNEACHLYAWQD